MGICVDKGAFGARVPVRHGKGKKIGVDKDACGARVPQGHGKRMNISVDKAAFGASVPQRSRDYTATRAKLHECPKGLLGKNPASQPAFSWLRTHQGTALRRSNGVGHKSNREFMCSENWINHNL